MTDTVAKQSAGTAVLGGVSEGVMTITLNRPEKANSLRPDDRNAVIELLGEADGSPDVRVVVLRANGRHFCTGVDVSTLGGDVSTNTKRVTDSMRRIMNGAQRLMTSILDCGKPVIAVVQGGAAGIGAHLAYAADLVVATEEAYFAESFAQRGLVVDGAGAYLLPRRIGMQKAKEMAFFGDKLPAAEALTLGLVNRVVPADRLDSAVEELTSRLAGAATSAISLTKRLLNASPDSNRDDALVTEAMAQEIQGHSHDSGEGVRSFIEKRPAEYRGW